VRKIISALLCLATTFPMVGVPAFAEEISGLTKAETVIMNMGIISEEAYSGDAEVTRGEFAKIIVDMLRIGDDEREIREWQENTQGADKTSAQMQVKKNVFGDVDESHPYCYEIELVKTRGIMNGVSSLNFAPEYGITVREATKVIVDLAGYSKQAEMMGGYPAGYQAVATELGLDKNISGGFSDVITKSELARVIYNAFSVEMMEFRLEGSDGAFYEYSDETFLTGVMKMNKLRGRVTDNGFVSLSGESFVGRGKITVDGLELILPEKFIHAIDYIGQEVELFYTNDLEEENHVTSIELADDKAVTFDIKDFEKFDGTTITYLENGKVVNKRIDKNAELILNNNFEEVWDKSVFDAPNGSVTLVSRDGNDFDLILVTAYEYAIVSSIDNEDKIIYNRLKGGEISEKYDLSEDTEKGIYIEDEKGGKMDFSEIEKNDVLNIINSDNYIKIVVKKNPEMTLAFKGIKEENGQKLLSTADKTYALSRFYNKLTTKSDIILSQEYVVYLNSFDEIIFIEVFSEKSKDTVSGILTNVYYDEDEQVRQLKIYGENGKMSRYESYEKIKVNGIGKKFENYVDFLTASVGSVVLFTTDIEDKVTEIVIPEEFGDTKELGWYEIASGDNFQYGENKDFNNLFYADNSTLVYTIPDDKEYYNDEDYFTVNAFSFKHSTWYSLKAYARDKNNVVAEVIVVEQNADDGVLSAGRISEEAMFLITDITVGLNEDNVPVKKFAGYDFNWRVAKPEYKEYIVSEDAIMIDIGNPGNKLDETKPIEEVGPRTYDELEPGDAIYFGTNIKGELTVIRTAFDYSQKKTFLGGRTSGDAYTYATNTPWYGGAISVMGNGLRIATNKIKNPTGTPKAPNEIDYNDFAEVSEHVCSFIMVPAKIVVVEEIKKGKFTARLGSPEDIITYMDAGTYDNVLVSTNWRSNLYATVIYK